MEVKFANKKKAPQKQEQAAAPPPQEAAPAPSGGGGEEQFKKLMPLAIIGLVLIVGLLIFLARKPSGDTPTKRRGVPVALNGGSVLRGKAPGVGTFRKPTFNKSSLLRGGSAGAGLFSRRPAVPAARTPALRPPPRFRPRALRRGRRGGLRTAPAATPDKAPKKIQYCLFFGRLRGGDKGAARKDIASMARRISVRPARLRLSAKPCCQIVLGPYPDDQKRLAFKHLGRLERDYKKFSLDIYQGLYDKIFLPGKDWQPCKQTK